MVSFPTRIPDCDSHSHIPFDFFLSPDPRICSTVAFPQPGNSQLVVVSVSIDFPSNFFFYINEFTLYKLQIQKLA